MHSSKVKKLIVAATSNTNITSSSSHVSSISVPAKTNMKKLASLFPSTNSTVIERKPSDISIKSLKNIFKPVTIVPSSIPISRDGEEKEKKTGRGSIGKNGLALENRTKSSPKKKSMIFIVFIWMSFFFLQIIWMLFFFILLIFFTSLIFLVDDFGIGGKSANLFPLSKKNMAQKSMYIVSMLYLIFNKLVFGFGILILIGILWVS